jgi:hypothetical protein
MRSSTTLKRFAPQAERAAAPAAGSAARKHPGVPRTSHRGLVRPVPTADGADPRSRAGQPFRSSVQADAGQGALDSHTAHYVLQVSAIPLTLLVAERERRLYVLRPEKIDYIEAHGNYVKLHSGSIEYISRDSVKRLAIALASSGFIRIERSLLVNVRAIEYAQREGGGSYAFTLLSGLVLHSGAKYREHILQVLPLAHSPGRAKACST